MLRNLAGAVCVHLLVFVVFFCTIYATSVTSVHICASDLTLLLPIFTFLLTVLWSLIIPIKHCASGRQNSFKSGDVHCMIIDHSYVVSPHDLHCYFGTSSYTMALLSPFYAISSQPRAAAVEALKKWNDGRTLMPGFRNEG